MKTVLISPARIVSKWRREVRSPMDRVWDIDMLDVLWSLPLTEQNVKRSMQYEPTFCHSMCWASLCWAWPCYLNWKLSCPEI